MLSFQSRGSLMASSTILTFALVLNAFGVQEVRAKCGYESCHPEKAGMMNVHLVSHTHTDPGWLITADQYYYNQVQFVLDTIIRGLEENEDRRFTYVEMSFLSRWWGEQDESMKKRVRALVNEGRLDFTMGGWVMNDEAASYYTAIIDQHTLGFDFLRTEFGKCGRTRIGWQIDPFGHSREQASLFAQYGLDGFFFGRLDHQDYDNRKKTHTMEFLWHGSPDNLGQSSDIFTGILPNRYVYPNGFHFDVSQIYTNGKQKFIHDDPTLDDYNVDEMVDNFIKEMNEYNAWYNTDHVIATMGDDYNYVDAHLNFKEIDKLIKHVNARQSNGSKVNLLYSTPSCYLKALNDAGLTWTTKSDDFFPYSHRNHSYWTGYYTSRPSQKSYTRNMGSLLQATRQLASLAKLDNSDGDLDNIRKLAAAVSVNQHHDAITGTEKQVVAYDYYQRLSRGQDAAEKTMNSAFDVLMNKGKERKFDQKFCRYLNATVCNTTCLEKSFEFTLYNPLARTINISGKLPAYVEHGDLYIEDGKSFVKNPYNPPYAMSQDIPQDSVPKGMYPMNGYLIFPATLPPMGFLTYFVHLTFPKKSRSETAREEIQRKKSQSPLKHDIVLETKAAAVHVNDSGIFKLVNKLSNISTPFQHQFFYYIPSPGNNTRPEFQASGAYVFRPANNTPVELKPKFVFAVNYDYPYILIAYEMGINLMVRLHRDKPYLEFEWTVGPIPIKDGGKEIIARYSLPGFGNNGVFYTDSNGRELIKRKLNYRPTWKADIDEPVAGNYYPVDSHIHIQSGDGKKQFTVLTDRSQGGSSLNDGEIELMIHRRLLHDDWLGVGEALNEPGLDGKGLITIGTHYISFETTEKAARTYRPLAQEINNPVQHSISLSGMKPTDYAATYTTRFSGVTRDLPPAVNLLTLERFRGDGPVSSPAGSVPYLVRFEHIYEAHEDEIYSKPVTFDIKGLFSGLEYVAATELALGGNMPASDVHRLKWKFKDGQKEKSTGTGRPKMLEGSKVTLKPMQIVTLQVDFKA